MNDADRALAGLAASQRQVFTREQATPAMQRTYRKDGRHIARVDFDFDPLPIIAEVGGRRGYMSGAERRRQERRRNQLQPLGRVVYFFTTEDVVESADYVVSTLSKALARAA